MRPIKASWPGPVTWIFPKSLKVPSWVSGGRKTIAIRMSAHPTCKALSEIMPILSTSVNLSGEKPLKALTHIKQNFTNTIDAYFAGALGGADAPSQIYHAVTGERLR